MKFPYTQIADYFMPIIPVTLLRDDWCIVTEALVDSGAASCLFDAQFAKALGIDDVESGSEEIFEGISGDPLIGYRHRVTLQVGGHYFPGVPIAFSRDMPDNAVNILGQRGFFNLCPLKFTWRQKEIDLLFER